MNPRTSPRRTRLRSAQGFTLIELMVAMLLGLVVIAGVGSVFIASQRSYNTNEALSEVQDASRIAFEMMARDIRRAGMTGCNNNDRVANVLEDASTDWFANWNDAVIGYGGSTQDPAAGNFGTAKTQRVAGTDSVTLVGADDSGASVKSHQPTSAVIFLNEASASFADGDLVVVCDPDHATIMQVTQYTAASSKINHDPGSGTPGNCSKGLGYPTVCSGNALGNQYEFPKNSQVAKLTAVDWYIGYNDAGGKSLYRVIVENVGGIPKTSAQEMVRNVTDMTIRYHKGNDPTFVDAATIGANWSQVNAVQVTLTVQSTGQRVSADNKSALTRTFTATTTIRNRVL